MSPRSFLSPAERQLLEELPDREADLIREAFDHADAHLAPEDETSNLDLQLGMLDEKTAASVRQRRDRMAP